MKIFEGGNFNSVARVLLALCGIGIAILGYKINSLLCIILGLLVGSVGGYASQAHALHLHPFGESEWRKAKRTYGDAGGLDQKKPQTGKPQEGSIDLLSLRYVFKLVMLTLAIMLIVLFVGLLVKNIFNIDLLAQVRR